MTLTIPIMPDDVTISKANDNSNKISSFGTGSKLFINYVAFRTDKNIVVLNSGQIFLPITAALDDVKKVMEDNSICQDVFITKTGSKDEAVAGWITNNIVIEKAELFKRSGSSS